MAPALDPARLRAFVRARLEPLADPARARGAQAYLKTEQPMFGVSVPQVRAVAKEAAGAFAAGGRADFEAGVLALWAGPERELRYAALDWAGSQKAFLDPGALPLFERLVREGAWWDLVDGVAVPLVGPILLAHREAVRPVLERWVEDPDPWVRRSALIAHNRSKARADLEQLFRHCLRLAPETGFFVRKAIGWALREASKHHPDAVRAFLEANRGRLSGLSYREGMKGLARLTPPG